MGLDMQLKRQIYFFRIAGWSLLCLGIIFLIIGEREYSRKYNDFKIQADKSLIEFAKKGREMMESENFSKDDFFELLKEEEEEVPEKIYYTWLVSVGGASIVIGFFFLGLGYMEGMLRYLVSLGKNVNIKGLFINTDPPKKVSIENRLNELDELKKKGLISELEYQNLRTRILQNL